jgi:hypothetical protein
MLQTDITILKHREKVLEKEIDEALSHTSIDDLMIAHLKSRILYLKEEIDRLRHEDFVSYHWVMTYCRQDTLQIPSTRVAAWAAWTSTYSRLLEELQ